MFVLLLCGLFTIVPFYYRKNEEKPQGSVGGEQTSVAFGEFFFFLASFRAGVKTESKG